MKTLKTYITEKILINKDSKFNKRNYSVLDIIMKIIDIDAIVLRDKINEILKYKKCSELLACYVSSETAYQQIPHYLLNNIEVNPVAIRSITKYARSIGEQCIYHNDSKYIYRANNYIRYVHALSDNSDIYIFKIAKY